MSILIKGIDLPKNCFDCEIFGLCSLRDRLTHIEDRNPDCPLVEIVTCGECKHWYRNKPPIDEECDIFPNADDFCPYGERRSE